jgi:predicted secreted Zn-dependent protease
MEKTAMKKVAKAEVKAHEKKMHGKGYRAGGKTNLDMKKIANQKSPMMRVRKTGI